MLPPDSHGSWPGPTPSLTFELVTVGKRVPPRSLEMRYRVRRQASRAVDDAPFMGPGPRSPRDAGSCTGADPGQALVGTEDGTGGESRNGSGREPGRVRAR